MRSQVAYLIRDYADLTIAKTKVRQSPLMAAATEQHQSELITIMSELGTNILKYAGHGYIGIRRIEDTDKIDIEVFAEDEGPGIADVELALQEQFSTGKTLGLGLPAVMRMTDHMRIESNPGHGTKIFAVKRIRGRPIAKRNVAIGPPAEIQQINREYDVGRCVRPKPGETDCGDITFYRPLNNGALMAIADATGHGTTAAQCARKVYRTLAEVLDPSSLPACFAKLDQNLRGTPGAAAGLLYVDFKAGTALYAGLSEQTIKERMRHLYEKPASTIAYDILMRASKPYDDAAVLVLKSPLT